jgi:hypothetical protein
MLTSCGSPNVLREEEIGPRGPRIPSFRLEEHVLEGANAGTSRRDDAFSLVAAVGSYSYKGEDRFVLWRNDSSKQEETEGTYHTVVESRDILASIAPSTHSSSYSSPSSILQTTQSSFSQYD